VTTGVGFVGGVCTHMCPRCGVPPHMVWWQTLPMQHIGKNRLGLVQPRHPLGSAIQGSHLSGLLWRDRVLVWWQACGCGWALLQHQRPPALAEGPVSSSGTWCVYVCLCAAVRCAPPGHAVGCLRGVCGCRDTVCLPQ
jgi:hypothetical protein